MKTLFVCAVVLAFTLGVVSAQVPIPKRPDGFYLGNADAPVFFELTGDNMCPDTRAVWDTVKQVIAHYGADKLRFAYHVFPLPYHHNSYYANQGMHVVAQHNASGVFGWVETVFAHQEAFGNSVTANMSANQVIAAFGKLAPGVGVSQADFVAGINDPNLDEATRISWKYSCSRGITGTPTFMVNGVIVEADLSWTLKQWQQVLDPLYSDTKEVNVNAISNNDSKCPSGEPECEYLPGKYQCCKPGENCIPNVGCRC